MSVDDRLRNALRDQAKEFVPPVETSLDRVRARGERRRGASAALATSAAAVIAICGGWAVGGLTGGNDVPPAEPLTAPASPTGVTEDSVVPLRGQISADVREPIVLFGTWTLTLNGNGTINAAPPPGYEGDLSGALFTADLASFRTTLFQADVCRGVGTGIYSWLRVRDRIEFETISDGCGDRSAFFENSTWLVSTEPASRD